MKARYPLNQSPLYKLANRRRLAELLGLTIQDLNRMARMHNSFYKVFDKVIEKDGKQKIRHIENPTSELRHVQRKFVRLLDRIEPPEYLHSGVRRRSYITNALRHPLNSRVAKIDIKNFFPSAYAGRVHRSFEDVFECSPDVAGIITKLTTAFGHIPTGGNSSTIISFYAFKPMFDEIETLALNRGLVMSCCVDDMTFSGNLATSGFLNEVRLIVLKYGLKTHKCHCFEASQSKVITGVAVTNQGFRLPNNRRKKLHDAFGAFDDEASPAEKVALGARMLGRATEAAQVEKKFAALVPYAAKKLKAAKRSMWAVT